MNSPLSDNLLGIGEQSLLRACNCDFCKSRLKGESQVDAESVNPASSTLTTEMLIGDDFVSHMQNAIGNSEEINYFIESQAYDVTFADGTTGVSAGHVVAEIDFINDAIVQLDNLIDLDFVESEFDDGGTAFNIYSMTSYNPWDSDTLGEVLLQGSGSGAYWDVLWKYNDFSDNDKNTIIHEIGHALGLSHPNNQPNNPTWDTDDTVMSYVESSDGWDYSFSELDIAALQQIWGVEDDNGGVVTDGTATNNILRGTQYGDELFGLAGNDSFYALDGDDIINGGTGLDTAHFSSASNYVDLSLENSHDTGDGIDHLVSIENIYAGDGDDNVIGNSASNCLYGEEGEDDLGGYNGNDVLDGGSGRDTAWFSSRSNRINLNTTRWQNTRDGRDRLISIENVNAGSGNDVVTGNKAANTLNGQNGNDRLYGGGGNDVLIGGGGKDRVWGQGGRDTFRVQRGSGYTIIEDFNNGQDRIQLGSGASGLQLKNRGGDVYLYQRGDLMAVVEDAAGDLQRSGNFLV